MSQYLPYANYKWVKNIDKIKQKLMNIKSNSSTGYILEVDLEYPQELHDIHNDYPLAPEKINIPKEWLSKYCLKIANAHNITTGKVKKLVPNLMNKNNYVIHYRNLQQCLQLGMKLKKIHRVLKFKQKDWMKPYIDFNTQKRKEATNEADKNLFKLLNNAVYGKTMENMRKRIKIKIMKNEKDFIKYASRPTYINHNIFGKRLVAIHEEKELLTLNKPFYVGCTVLELSKLEMNKFHYDFMKKNSDSVNTLVTDTDSFIYEISENPHEIMHQHKEFFDLSNYPRNSKYFCNDNKKVLRKMKDEYGGKIIYEITALKSKMYSIQNVNNDEKSINKGHNSSIKYEEFKDTHFNKKAIKHKMRGIKSKNHELVTYESNKRSLCNFDDKRYILSDGMNTYYMDIKIYQKMNKIKKKFL